MRKDIELLSWYLIGASSMFVLVNLTNGILGIVCPAMRGPVLILEGIFLTVACMIVGWRLKRGD